MSGVITTSSFAKSLWPGVNTWFGQAYAEYQKIKLSSAKRLFGVL